MLRALARVDLGAIERNCARLRAAAAPARAVRGGQGRRLRPRRGPAARAALAGGATWLAVATAREAARAARRRASTAPLLVMGALSPEELAVALAAGADVVAWREAFVAALRPRAAARVHVKLDTGMGRLGTRDPDEATRVAEAVAAAPRPAARGRDDPLRHRRRARRRLHAREQLARFAAVGRAAARAHPGMLVHAANSRRDAARARRRASTWSAAASRSTAWTRSSATRPTTASSPRSSCAPTSPRSSARAGRERRLRAALRRRARRPGSARSRSATATACGAALTNNADVLVGGRRVPLRRHGLDGQHHGRPRRRRRRPRARRRGGADRRQGGERILAEEWRRAARHDQLRDHVRDQRARAARVPPRRGAASA